MQMHVFTIHDSKAQAFIQPWYSPNTDTAIRQFTTAVRDPATEFSKYPGDYTLFHLGTFNQEKATFDLLKTPENLGLALVFVGTQWDDQPSTVTQLREALTIEQDRDAG